MTTDKRLIDPILDHAIQTKTSDIHLTIDLPPVFRIDGNLTQQHQFDVSTPELLRTYTENVLSDKHMDVYNKERFIDSALAYNGMRFRVHVFRQSGSDALVLRLIPTTMPKFDDINLPEVVRSLTKKKNGLVLVTGVTGSGKSTTLASLISEINHTQSKHIVTVEDPIEFVHSHKQSIVNQREVGEDVHNFADAVKAAMREDPDILLVGEMRDLETIGNAITMAESGHLVFGTLHTRSAADTVDRIIDVFPPSQQEQIRMQLSNSIEGIVSQDLLPRIGGGRVPSVEIMIANDAIRNLIRNPSGANAVNDQIRGNKSKLGSQTRIQSLADLYVRELITIEDAQKGLKDAEIRELVSTIKNAQRGG